MNLKTYFVFILTPCTFMAVLFCSYLINRRWTSEAFGYSCLLGLCGIVTGWLIGILVSPVSNEEQAKFSSLTTGLIGLVAGYASEKIFEPIVKFLFEEKSIFTDKTVAANVLVFLTCLILATINGYSYRIYLAAPKKD
jgi:hypothetical protein